jgi:crossover junction endodeoxyribonuclease RuvC
MSNTTDRIIIGIDPGTVVMGYGIIHIVGQKVNLVALGILKLDKFKDHPTRLKTIFERTSGLVREYKPDEMAIEAPFYGSNVQSMLKLGRAQGVCMAAALAQNIPVEEYSPRKVKQSVTGNGSASKEQVAAMLQNILGIKADQYALDATDALAVAMCHHFQNKVPGGKTAVSGWASFLKQNPGRQA